MRCGPQDTAWALIVQIVSDLPKQVEKTRAESGGCRFEQRDLDNSAWSVGETLNQACPLKHLDISANCIE